MLIIDFIWFVGSKKNWDGSEKNRLFESSPELSYLLSLALLSVSNWWLLFTSATIFNFKFRS